MLTSIFGVLQNASPSEEKAHKPEITNSSEEVPIPTNLNQPTATGTPSENNAQTQDPSRGGPKNPDGPIDLITPGTIEAAQKMNRSVWGEVAKQAWAYFKPGFGIDISTGLPSATFGWPYFTDWDLGAYIQTVIDAQKMGLIGKSDDWGTDYRIDKVLSFLETRLLNEYNYPFWFYKTENGQPYMDRAADDSVKVDLVDTGKLFVALNNLRRYDPSFAPRIENIVFNGRSNYTALLPLVQSEATLTSLYAYYVWSGFAAFWPNEAGYVPAQILSNLQSIEQINVNVNIGGRTLLPNADIACEPLLHAVFDLEDIDAGQRSYLIGLSRQVYQAHEEYYNLTERMVAFSEGGSGTETFIYEWVNLRGVGPWKITTIDRTPFTIKPIIYSKVALSFLALYDTSYSKSLCVYLERSLPPPTQGWGDGADYTTVKDERLTLIGLSCNTNGMIVAASRYFIQNNP